MDRTERFYKIERLIRSRGCVSFAALREALDVSPATLKRDLAYLRDRLDAPIVYDAMDNGYRFASGAGPGGGTRHELPGVWFSEAELHALLTMHELLAGLDDGGLIARHLQPVADKLLSMLGDDDTQARELARRVKLIGTARRRGGGRWFEVVGAALSTHHRLWMRYLKRADGSVGEREVSPQRLVHYRHSWYLDAWCHASDGLRRFALDAIEEARVLDGAAREVPTRELEQALDGGYGIFAGGTAPQWARLRFEPEAASWVAHEEWHPAQRGGWLEGGRYELEVPFGQPTELLMDLGRHAGLVQVLAPASLRQAHRQRLQQALALDADVGSPDDADAEAGGGLSPDAR